MQNPYRVLDLPSRATSDEVRRAYRSLARRHHPDTGEPTTERFVEIRAAYELLSDPATRDEYDRSHEGYAERRHHEQFATTTTEPGYATRRHQREFAQPLSMIARDVDDLVRGAIEAFDLLDRGWVHEGLTHRREDTLHYDLQLSPREAAEGGHFRFSTPVRRRCPACGIVTRIDCARCEGDGYVVDEREIDIVVPAGVRAGATCTLPLDAVSARGGNIEVTVRVH
jgi:DnaJ-class molecular chaperone